MDSFRLICLQMELECMRLDDQRNIIRLHCENPDEMHRVFAVRYEGEEAVLFQAGLPEGLRKKLAQIPFDEFFTAPKQIRAVLAEHAPCPGYFVGKSYIFPDNLSAALYTRAIPLVDVKPDFDTAKGAGFAVVEDGQVVSTCESSHESASAGEAWVQTLEAYRRRGYARQVTLAWAHHLQRQGKVPFYSHLWNNLASQSLAESMGLIQFLDAAGYA